VWGFISCWISLSRERERQAPVSGKVLVMTSVTWTRRIAGCVAVYNAFKPTVKPYQECQADGCFYWPMATGNRQLIFYVRS
jgi:hypothetical protein